MKKKKMYLVKREVFATSIERAAFGKGVIYEITTAEDKFQPEDRSKTLGFKKKT